MDERELLSLAAKAAGIELVTIDGALYFKDHALGNEWRPQHNDGQALRLAVKLGLEIYHSINCDRWTVFVGYPKNQRIVYAKEEWGDDELAATRLAIVRAAAEIGAQQKGGGNG